MHLTAIPRKPVNPSVKFSCLKSYTRLPPVLYYVAIVYTIENFRVFIKI